MRPVDRSVDAAMTLNDATKTSYRQLWTAILAGSPDFPRLAAATALALAELAAVLAFPILARNLIDGLDATIAGAGGFAANRDFQLLIATLVGGALLGAFSKYLLGGAGLKIIANLKRRLVRQLIWMPVSYFDARETGEHISRVANDTGTIARFLTEEFLNAVSGIFLLIGSAIILFILDARLAGVLFAIILSAFILIAPVAYRMSRIGFELNEGTARLTAKLGRSFGEIRLVKAFTAEPIETARHEREIENLYRHSLDGVRAQALLQPVVTLALSGALISIFLYGGGRVQLGTLSIGTLTAFILYIFNVAAPLIQLSSFFTQLQASRGASLRIAQILDMKGETPPAAALPAPTPTPEPQARDLVFRDVRFSYGGSLKHPLKLDALTLGAGRRTAIVGPSGAGKTTIFSLILRFYEPEAGRIFYGDTPIGEIPLYEWRRRIGYVPQAAPLLAGTIRDNLVYGVIHSVSDEEIEAAAEAANCLDFIRASEAGFDTQVGESGVRLSGGQKQRLAIARMLMRDPQVLLLDEPSSALDQASEAAILSALERVMAGRTTLIITHRRSALIDVDQIVRLERGILR